MQYMLMCCIDESLWNGLSAGDRDRVMLQYGGWIQGIRESGHHLVECRDMDEALSIARRIPTLPVGGTVEVRQLEPPL